jgi:hypothetical protein
MTSELKSNILPPEMVGLPHLSRELIQIVEPDQNVPNRDRLYNLICSGDLQMIVYVRGRWYCPRPELPALAQSLGLRLREPARPARPRASRSAAA